ncbi:MAG TPA: HD domain-containing protein [Candidatus Angelobacter sp.]|nr:HD domain-containing protein [Candidatus Angelobacter sp.]
MLSNDLRIKVWEIADSYYPKHDWAHGGSHIQRVLRMAMEIGKQEGADLEVIGLAAMLHDIFENKEQHSGVERFRHEIEGSKEAKKILEKLGVKDKTIDAVCHCIESHRKRAGSVEPHTIEAKCLFDADKLDCIGAIGILRSAFVSFDHGQEVYREEGDIDAYKRRNIRADGTIIDFTLHSSNLEYELSLKFVSDRMFTEAGKRLAIQRAAFMDEFYSRLEGEMKGIL